MESYDPSMGFRCNDASSPSNLHDIKVEYDNASIYTSDFVLDCVIAKFEVILLHGAGKTDPWFGMGGPSSTTTGNDVSYKM